MAEVHDVQLTLNDPQDFFVAPDYDPFDPINRDVSGIEYLISYMNGRKIRDDDWRLTLYLPAEQITPDLPQKMQAAIVRYSERQIESNNNQIRTFRSEGFRTIPFSLILVGIGVLIIWLSSLLVSSSALQTLLTIAVINIYYLAGWWPVELLFFDPLEYRRLSNTHRAIIDMPKEYKPLPI